MNFKDFDKKLFFVNNSFFNFISLNFFKKILINSNNFFGSFNSLNSRFNVFSYKKTIYSFLIDFSSNFFVKFKVVDLFQYVNLFKPSQININYLRKSKVFNKGRYSRNRQNYRTGVY